MDSTTPNIGGDKPKDPYEQYRIDAIEREKREKEKEGKQSGEKRGLSLATQILVLVRRVIDFFLSVAEEGEGATVEGKARENLVEFRRILDTLKTEDKSQDVAFLNHFSEVWQAALEDSLRFKRSHPFSAPFREFLTKIQRFPEDQEHTLGYYLTEYTGHKWLPFPYMELIQKIHRDYILDPLSSPLSEWAEEINQLLKLLLPE